MGKKKKKGLASQYLKSKSKNKYTIRMPKLQRNSAMSRRAPLRDEESMDRTIRSRKKPSKKEQIYGAIRDFSPGQIRAAQMRAGIKGASKKKEGKKILEQLLSPNMTITEQRKPKRNSNKKDKENDRDNELDIDNEYTEPADELLNEIDENLETPPEDPVLPSGPSTIYSASTRTDNKGLMIAPSKLVSKKTGTDAFKRRKRLNAQQRRASTLRINKSLNL